MEALAGFDNSHPAPVPAPALLQPPVGYRLASAGRNCEQGRRWWARWYCNCGPRTAGCGGGSAASAGRPASHTWWDTLCRRRSARWTSTRFSTLCLSSVSHGPGRPVAQAGTSWCKLAFRGGVGLARAGEGRVRVRSAGFSLVGRPSDDDHHRGQSRRWFSGPATVGYGPPSGSAGSGYGPE
jgi:hypothetical protein